MAKAKCSICNVKLGKRKCLITNTLICPVCCAKTRDEDKCGDCKYFEQTVKFETKKAEKQAMNLSSLFGSPQNQKTIMEASIDLMNNKAEIGKELEKDTDKFQEKAFAFYTSEEFSEYKFEIDEIKYIIKKLGEPEDNEEWFHSEAGTEYYTKAVEMIMNEIRFRKFSQSLFKIFLKYYRKNDFETAWLLLTTVNRMMEGEFTLPFTTLMFFKGLADYRKS